MKINILYEDPNLLAIDKPSGILTHPDGRKDPSTSLRARKTILDLFIKKYPKIELVHRLDKETSGVMLLAKNSKAHEALKKQFSAPAHGLKTKSGLADRQDRIKKIYVAIVDGVVKNDRGTINKPIGRSPRDFRRWLAGRGARGELREAVTEYKVLKRLTLPINPSLIKEGKSSPDKGRKEGFTFLEVRPKTGRTHQIRVHMKYLNHPVACDSLYNPGKPCPKGFKRLALHALSIEFKDLKDKTIKVESPLPKEFKKLI